MARIEVVTKAMWVRLTATLTTWQADRKNELEQARAIVVSQGTKAEQAGIAAVSMAEQARAEALKLAPVDQRFISLTTDSPRIPTVEEWQAAGGHDSRIIGTRLSGDDVQLIRYNGASGGWDVYGAPAASRTAMTSTLTVRTDRDRRNMRGQRNSALRNTLTALSLGRAVSIVCIGSSSTEGAGYGAATKEDAYPGRLQAYLQAMYPNAAVTVHNVGIAGQSAQQMMERFNADVIAKNPTLVVWQTGTVEALGWVSTSLSDYMAQLEAGCYALRAIGADVILMDSQDHNMADRARYELFLWGMATVGRRLNIPIYSRYRDMRDLVDTGQYRLDQLLHNDAFHPSALMYDRMARGIGDMLSVPQVEADLVPTVFYPMTHRSVRVSNAVNVSAPWVFINPASKPYPEITSYNVDERTEGTRWLEVQFPFWGTGARMRVPLSSQHGGLTATVTVDGGAPTTIPTIALASAAGGTVHGGGFTVAADLTLGWHLVRIRFQVPLNSGGGERRLYFLGFEVDTPLAALPAYEHTPKIISGLPVSAKDGLTLRVDYGNVLLTGMAVPIDGVDVALAAADAQARVDLVYVDNDRVVKILKGAPGGGAPEVPRGVWALATVQVPGGATAPGAITDLRRMA